MPGYAALLKSTNAKPIKFYSVADPVDGKETMLPFTTDAGAEVLGWDPEGVQYWIQQAFTKAEYSESSVEIRDAYGPGGTDRASALGTYLKYTKSLPTVNYGPDQPQQAKTTIVLNRASRLPLAQDIANWLRIDPSMIEQNTTTVPGSAPDIVITIGQDYQIPQ
jgi:hypothetical protein